MTPCPTLADTAGFLAGAWGDAMSIIVRPRSRAVSSRRARPIRSTYLRLERLEARDLPAVTVSVDAAADRHAISPLVYGTAFADAAALRDLNVPFNRSGGNTTSRYNWQQNAANHASDFYFESLAHGSATPAEEADNFVLANRAAGAETSLTIPTVGWVAKLGPNRGKLASFSIAKYGPQTDRDAQFFPDAGNGISAAT